MNSNTRKKYPKNWKKLSRLCREQAGWQCQECFVLHGTLRVSYSGREYPVYLQAAHVHHDPWNEDPELVCVCPRCHYKFYRKPGQPPVWLIERLKLRRVRQQKGGLV